MEMKKLRGWDGEEGMDRKGGGRDGDEETERMGWRGRDGQERRRKR